MPLETPDTGVRLAELVAALSRGIDLCFGQPMEHVLRQCLIGMRLAECLGLGAEARATVYYTALLVNVGCHTDAHEQAKWFGDDIALKSHKFDDKVGMASTLSMLGAGQPVLQRFRLGLEFIVSGHRELSGMIVAHATIARSLARQLELPESTGLAVGAAYEQWDGKGWPGELAGQDIPLAARIAALSELVEVAHRIGGVEQAAAVARARSAIQFDPAIVTMLCAHATEIFADLDSAPAWPAVIDAEPGLTVHLSEAQFDSALTAIANFVDLKSPFMLGHSQAVAALAAAAGAELGLPSEETTRLRRAGLVHGFGRLGVSNAIWDKRGPLGAGERERVRMHPYFTDRILRQSSALAPLGAIAVLLRERLDGSGYPRGLSGNAISLAGRILGATDAYLAMRAPRPHRSALLADEAAELLRSEARAMRLDPAAVEAVLKAAGHRAARRREGPAGLTLREIDVLRLLARGLSTKEIAQQLFLSPKTASNHIEHIYQKIAATNRVTASLFAVQNGLLPQDDEK